MPRSAARQPSLFDEPAPEPAPRKFNVSIIRKTVFAHLRTLRSSEYMPWCDFEVRDWEVRFPRYCGYLEPEEGAEALADFNAELARLKKATAERDARAVAKKAASKIEP
jgi:hypothetical protein